MNTSGLKNQMTSSMVGRGIGSCGCQFLTPHQVTGNRLPGLPELHGELNKSTGAVTEGNDYFIHEVLTAFVFAHSVAYLSRQKLSKTLLSMFSFLDKQADIHSTSFMWYFSTLRHQLDEDDFLTELLQALQAPRVQGVNFPLPPKATLRLSAFYIRKERSTLGSKLML